MAKIGRILRQATSAAKQFARNNPDKVRGGLDKVQGVINQRTQGKHKDKLAKGASAVEKALGIQPGPSSPSVPPESGTAGPGTSSPNPDTPGPDAPGSPIPPAPPSAPSAPPPSAPQTPSAPSTPPSPPQPPTPPGS